MRHFIFCHGFGFDHDFWNNLVPYFAQEKYTYLDHEYLNKPTSFISENQEQIIGIGHSLGLLKLLQFYKNFDCLIGLNGFVNFLGNDLYLKNKRYLELELLKQHLIKNPIATLRAFYNRCGIPSFINKINKEELNLDLMLSELELLTLNLTPPASTPMLIITSKNDEIVPVEVVYDNFLPYPNAKLVVTDCGQHGLGFLEEHYVYKEIMSFIDENCTD